mgnify:CR=1 FL=1
MNKIQEIYNTIPAIVKEHAGFPDDYINLTNDQERLIIDIYQVDRREVKRELLETINEMKELVNEL